MASTIWWGPGLLGKHGWMLPHDLWGTLVAGQRLAHLEVGGLYTPPTGLISLPGAAVILVPVAALISAAGLPLQIPGPYNPHPGAWLLAGPYLIIVSALALFAADAIAEDLGVLPAQARPARRRGCGSSVRRLGAMGSSRRRGSGGTAAVRHPGAVPSHEPHGPGG